MAFRPQLARELPTELLWNLTLREMRSKFKRSTLGWLWSVINPLANIAIYTVVFGEFFRVVPPVGDPSGLHMFGFYLVCGLLPWTFVTNSLTGAVSSIVGNEGLIKKVYFPRSVLPTATTLSWLASFGVELIVLGVALTIVGNMVVIWVPAVLLLMVLQTAFVLGLGLFLSAANAYFRDIQHFLAIALNIWFYATPIIYPPNMEGIPAWVRRLQSFNPMTQFVEAYRDVLYDLRWPSAGTWLAVVAISVISLVVGTISFRRLEPRLAEEL
ncbi:MAG: ABC transporter permease [Acidimicrobiales bacterium]